MTDKPQFNIYPQLDRDIRAASQPVELDGLAETVSADLESAKPSPEPFSNSPERAFEIRDWAGRKSNQP